MIGKQQNSFRAALTVNNAFPGQYSCGCQQLGAGNIFTGAGQLCVRLILTKGIHHAAGHLCHAAAPLNHILDNLPALMQCFRTTGCGQQQSACFRMIAVISV